MNVRLKYALALHFQLVLAHSISQCHLTVVPYSPSQLAYVKFSLAKTQFICILIVHRREGGREGGEREREREGEREGGSWEPKLSDSTCNGQKIIVHRNLQYNQLESVDSHVFSHLSELHTL